FEAVYAAPRRPVPHALQRAPLRTALDEQRAQCERKYAALQRSLAAAEDADALRAAGEAVLANLAAIEPGADRLAFGDQEIALDPAQTPLENAQRYFDDYTRARDARRVVPEVLEQTRLEVRYLDEMAAQLELAESPAALEQLRRELVLQGLLKPSRGEAKRGRPAAPRGGYERAHLEGFDVLIGASALGNERVTFELSDPNDVWLHARGVPGSHVIIRSGGRALPVEGIEQAAKAAAQRGASRRSGPGRLGAAQARTKDPRRAAGPRALHARADTARAAGPVGARR